MNRTQNVLDVPELPANHTETASIYPRPAPVSYNFLIGLAILIGAFLLFQVQLILGKYILPWFGGTPGVWSACLLFFQVILLGGYAYSHFVAMRLASRKQVGLHVGLMVVSVLVLVALAFQWPSPITPGAGWKPQADTKPTLLILQFLLASIGLQFFLLSTTSPLLQHWFSQRSPLASPYRLYALSNLGSLLGLLSYPLLVEPALTLRTQAWLWSGGYLLFALLCMTVAPWKFAGSPSREPLMEEPRAQEQSAGPSWSRQFFWTALAACASIMLLATTNIICQQVAVSPFLWVLPLSIYLLSFILCFESERFYRRGLFHPLFVLTAGAACALLLNSVDVPLLHQLVAFLMVMFASCMVCHGEIALTKPEPRYLTRFYLCIAIGGAFGGVFVNLVAPYIFPNLWEFPLGIIATAILLGLGLRRDPKSWWYRRLRWMPLALFAGILLMIPPASKALGVTTLEPPPLTYILFAGTMALAAAVVHVSDRRAPKASSYTVTRASALATVLLLACGFIWEARLRLRESVARERNFYGVLAVIRDSSPFGDFLFLRDRMVDHGMQFVNPQLARMAVGYYGPQSGINVLLRGLPPTPVRVGVVGLGTGNLAVFSRPGDVFRFYEINPAVLQYAHGQDAYFTYLRDAPGTIEIAPGDARLTLEREAEHGERQQFDVLVLDAFSGDAIPIHLLTREAFWVYLQHLRSADSVLAVHITNRSLDLSPVLAGIAADLNLTAIRVYRPWQQTFSSQTDWVLLSRGPSPFLTRDVLAAAKPLDNVARALVWTDDYSNLLHVAK